MPNSAQEYPMVGWFKERFKVVLISPEVFELECFMSPGGMAPPHFHEDCDEYFRGMVGDLTMTIEGETSILRPGEEVMVPRGVIHSLKNKNKEVVQFHVAFRPAADQSKLFEILMYLQDRNPSDKWAIVKAMWMSRKLGYKDFSTPVGANALFEKTIHAVTRLAALLMGWDTLVNGFRESQQGSPPT